MLMPNMPCELPCPVQFLDYGGNRQKIAMTYARISHRDWIMRQKLAAELGAGESNN